VDALHADVVRWLVFAQGESVTPSSVIEAAHRVLPSVGAGTDANFTELNRQRPTTALDWLVYSINPQVHAFDNASLVETLPVQTVTLACARTFAGGARLAVSPVTFKMRVNPAATSPETDTLASRVDARQMSLFGAGWTLGSLRALAEGRAHSVTFYETTGALGVMERAGDSVYPLYHVLADAGEFAGGDVLRVTSSHPLLSDGLALRRKGRLRVLIANYTDQTRRVRVRGLNGRFLHKSLDENSAVYAMTDPQGFRADTGTPVETVGGELLLDLFPYAVVRLDALSSTEDETL
jgi:D-apionolactonase